AIHAVGDLPRALTNVRRLLAPGGLLGLIEAVRAPLWADVIFGIFDGWWRRSDGQVIHSIRAKQEWINALHDAGFCDVGAVRDMEQEGSQAILIARQPDGKASLRDRSVVIFSDRGKAGERIGAALRSRGANVMDGDSCAPEALRRAYLILHLR